MAEPTTNEPKLSNPEAPEATGAEAGGTASESGVAGAEPPPKKIIETTVERSSRSNVERNLRRSAQAFFASANNKIFELLYSTRKTTAPVEEGQVPQEIPEEDLSFAVLARDVAEGYYGLDYGDAPFGQRKKREYQARKQAKTEGRTVETKTVAEQSPAAHAQARDIAKAVLQELFAQKKKALDELVAKMQARAKERSPDDPKKYLKLSVKKPHDQSDNGGSLEARIRGAYKSLERLRLCALDDVMDWYRQRVSQVEAQIQTASRRQSADDHIDKRIARVEQSSEIAEALNQLDMDYQLIAEVAGQDSIAPQEKDKKYFKDKFVARATAAERMKAYVKRSLERMREVLNPNQRGRNQVEAQADRLKEGILFGGEFFMAEARQQMIGLSPEEERNFLEALNELFDDIGGEITGKPETTERLARTQERWRAVNGTYRVIENYQDGKAQRQRLVRAAEGSEIKVGEDHVPQNMDELLARAKQEAILLGQLRQKLRRTFAIMGPTFAKLVRAELKGMPNADKIEAVEYMNGVLSAEQSKALKALGEDADFKTGLAGRELKELKWSNKADQPFIIQVRKKVYEALELGEVDKPATEKIPTLFAAPADEATIAEEKEIVAEQEPPEPILQKLLNGTIAAELVTSQTVPNKPDATSMDVAMYVDGLFRKITESTQSAQFREALKKTAVNLVEDVTTPEQLKDLMRRLENISQVCRALKDEYGPNWAREFGLIKPDKTIDQEWLEQACVDMIEVDHFLDVLAPSNHDQSRTWLMSQLNPKVRDRLATLKIPDTSCVDLMMMAVAGDDFEGIEHSQAMNRIAHYLETESKSREGLRGGNLLLLVGFIKLEGNEIAFQIKKVREVMKHD